MKSNKPIGLLFGNKPDSRTFLPDDSLPMSNKYIGIEIEAENIKYQNKDIHNILGYWSVVSDGSLRNYGTEFVSTKLRGGDISLALQEMEKVFAEYKIEPSYSDRTSVHIHVDARFLSIDHLRVLILHYLMHEPFLFQYIGHNREHNSYCVPYYRNNNGIKNLSKIFTQDYNDVSLLDVVAGAIKYEAMNLRSLREKGSIEFRAHYGTNDTETLLRWIKIILTLFRISKEASEDMFYMQLYKQDYKTYLEEIFQYTGDCSHIDLRSCEFLAHLSISKLLLYAGETQPKQKKKLSPTINVGENRISIGEGYNPTEWLPVFGSSSIAQTEFVSVVPAIDTSQQPDEDE